MREHTVTTIRQMLSSQDSDVVASLKANQQHKFRSLSETRISFIDPKKTTKTLQDVRIASPEAGLKDQAAIKGIANLLSGHPKALFNPKFWNSIGRGSISALLHGKFDPNYKIPGSGGTLSKNASSLERVGGPLATGAYKAGRALQKAEDWFNIHDPDAGEGQFAARSYSTGSAFDPRGARDQRDACSAKKFKAPGQEPVVIGYTMGTPEYEQCMEPNSSGWRELENSKNVLSRSSVLAKLPDVMKNLGIDAETYLKHRQAEVDYRGRKWSRKSADHRAQ